MSRASKPMVIGHRGSPGYRPEHTRGSFELAIAQGADAIEPDVVVTRDGVLVVRHENEISGTTDVADHPEFAARKATKIVDGERRTGWFTEDFDWEELKTLRCTERLPKIRPANVDWNGQFSLLRLQDVFALAAATDEQRALMVIVELKHAAYFAALGFDIAALLAQELRATGWDELSERLVIESFELGVLDELKALGVQAQFVFLMESQGAPADELAAHGASATCYEHYRSDEGLASLVGRVDGISVAKRELFERDVFGRTTGVSNLVTRAHALGLTVFSWTLRPENHFLNLRFRSGIGAGDFGDWRAEYLLALTTGLDGMFVDYVDLGVEVRDAFVSADSSTLEE